MIRQAEKPAGFFSLPSFGGNTKTPEEVVCVRVGGMAKTFTLDVARRALAKAKATCITSIIPICTSDQMKEIQQRIRAALEQRLETARITDRSNKTAFTA